MSPWRTRAGRPEDLRSLPEFLTPLGDESFRGRLRGKLDAYYRWKYGDGSEGSEYVRVAVNPDGLIGVVGMLPRRAQVGGRIVTALEMGDILTESSARRRGVFSTLGREICEMAPATAAFSYVKPNAESAPVLVNRLGFTPLVELETLVRPIRVSCLLARRLGGRSVGALGRALDTLFAVRASSGPPWLTREATFTDEFDDLWEAVAGGYAAIVVRDRAYLSWRYDANPTAYTVLAARDVSGRLQGYAVGLVVQWGARRIGYLVDILTRRDDRSTQIALARGILRSCAEEGAESVHTWIARTVAGAPSRLRSALRSLGFLSRSNRGTVLWRPRLGDAPVDPGDWHLTMSDFDGI